MLLVDLFTNSLIGACFVANSALFIRSKTAPLRNMSKTMLKHPKQILFTAAGVNSLIMAGIIQRYQGTTFLPSELISTTTDKAVSESCLMVVCPCSVLTRTSLLLVVCFHLWLGGPGAQRYQVSRRAHCIRERPREWHAWLDQL